MSKTLPVSNESSSWLKLVQDNVSRIRFGVVQVVVHDGKVTQIECTEKTRLDERSTSERRPR